MKTLELNIFVKPNAKRTALLAVKNKILHIAIHAKPQDGAANEELIRFLAKLFELPKSQITLKRGEKSRTKWLVVPETASVLAILNRTDWKD